jgi:hypothetical protein
MTGEVTFPEEQTVNPSIGASAVRAECSGFSAARMYDITDKVYRFLDTDDDRNRSVSASLSETEETNPTELLSQLTPLIGSNQEPQGVARKRRKNQRLNDFVT